MFSKCLTKIAYESGHLHFKFGCQNDPDSTHITCFLIKVETEDLIVVAEDQIVVAEDVELEEEIDLTTSFKVETILLAGGLGAALSPKVVESPSVVPMA